MPVGNNEKFYKNEYLFSEIYLEEITQNPEQEEIHASLNTLKEYRDYADISNLKTWKETFLHQVLYALGFNLKSETDHLTLLFPMGEDIHPITMVFCLLPSEDLNNTTMGRNWSEKIIRNLRDQKTQWGLLTNGEQWRVYHLDEPTPYETYLEIDLAAIFNNNAYHAFQIFYKFMRVDNFQIKEDDRCQFDIFKKESQDKIAYIENELANALKQKEEGGQGVLSSICMGYVEFMRQNGTTDFDDEDLRKKIYHGAMLYMFRLLFLYYADSRGLLSDQNHDLLSDIRQEAHSIMHKGDPNGESYNLWNALEQIFVDIDQTYNGGLFNPHESEFTFFIEDSRLFNNYLAPVIYHLAYYHESSGDEREVSYKDMSVRHLGTLYEGLLEHKLFITKEDTEIRNTKGNIKYIPVSKGGKLIQGNFIPKGQVYFGTDVNERKSSGSYYTPEYIVEYIVSKTLDEKLEKLFSKYFDLQKQNYDYYLNAVNIKEKHTFAELIKDETQKFIINHILRITILDPSMGSGHFLVEATNVLSNFITKMTNHFNLETSLETNSGYWRRWVVENCIYGVDLNPLAVELAKLSLWILSMARDRPLSFLKHHLKIGNSLIGAGLDQIGIYPISKGGKDEPESGQMSLFRSDKVFRIAVEKAIRNYHLISSKETLDLKAVENKKKWLDEINSELQDFIDVASLHMNIIYKENIDKDQYRNIVESKYVPKEFRNTTRNYFHWELEFPEVFINRNGFDLVIGNPPYDTIREDEVLSESDVRGTSNLFSHFISRAIDLNSHNGSIGFIIPLSLACGNSFEVTRAKIYMHYDRLFASHYSIRPAKLFPGVDQRTTIFIAENKNLSKDCVIYSSRLWRFTNGEARKVVMNPCLGFAGRIKAGVIPKLAGEVGAIVYQKILGSSSELGSLISDDGNHLAYYHSVARYWIKAYDFIPYFKREDEPYPDRSTKLKEVKFDDEFDKNLFLLLVNSSLFYYWWIVVSDEFDLLLSEIKDFRIPYNNFLGRSKIINSLVDNLMVDYKNNSKRSKSKAGGKGIIYDIFYPRYSIEIIRKIDDIVAEAYDFTKEEKEFLGSYDHEFRTDKD